MSQAIKTLRSCKVTLTHSPSGSPKCALFIVARLLLRLLGGKSSDASSYYEHPKKRGSILPLFTSKLRTCS
ncbi:hypothetical protein F9Y84_10080 [Pseudoalteromonas peptidolytica]|nr:hypothetical protein [Pseudoalteromonas peptidolytica]RXE95856.1 hypothetical protein D9603_19700 [Pseudoalteromonas sp. PS5]